MWLKYLSENQTVRIKYSKNDGQVKCGIYFLDDVVVNENKPRVWNSRVTEPLNKKNVASLKNFCYSTC